MCQQSNSVKANAYPVRDMLFVVVAVASARVIITPPAAPVSTIPATDMEERPCSVFSEELAEEAMSQDLPACARHPTLPSVCTRLLAQEGYGTVVPTQQPPGALSRPITATCGARVGATIVPPDSCEGGYYGHDASLAPEKVLEHGLAARGNDWDLIHHAEQAGSSAFRGTTKLVTFPGGGGAAAWADEGGFVYEITCVPSWDVNKHIQGRRMVSDLAVGKQRWGGNLVLGEHEHCIPARVPAEHIKRYGAVVTSASGVPFVPRNAWVANPRWNPCFCRYSLSDCEDTPCH